MITQTDEYKRLVSHRLEEDLKSFRLLFGMKHYGNCVSLMCQELDQMIRLLFLLNSSQRDRISFMESSINNHKWYVLNKENKKENITDETLADFTKTLAGWDKSIYDFGFAFKDMSNAFNYGSKDPIKGMSEENRKKLYDYIIAYHKKDFPNDFSINDLFPVLPEIINVISLNLKNYIEKI
jgi:hypothetical protein